VKGFPDCSVVGAIAVGKTPPPDQQINFRFADFDRDRSQPVSPTAPMPSHAHCTGRPRRSNDAMAGRRAVHLNVLTYLVERVGVRYCSGIARSFHVERDASRYWAILQVCPGERK
jgi:hypothetical protein